MKYADKSQSKDMASHYHAESARCGRLLEQSRSNDSCWMATLSNCGKVLKPLLPSRNGNISGGRGNDLGYGKSAKDDAL